MGDSLAIVRGNTNKMQGVIIVATMSLLTASTPRIFTFVWGEPKILDKKILKYGGSPVCLNIHLILNLKQ